MGRLQFGRVVFPKEEYMGACRLCYDYPLAGNNEHGDKKYM